MSLSKEGFQVFSNIRKRLNERVNEKFEKMGIKLQGKVQFEDRNILGS